MKYRFLTHGRLYVLLSIYLLLTTANNLLFPVINSDDADEAHNFQYIRFIAETRHLPSNLQERTAAGLRAIDGYPPLYQGLAGFLFSWINIKDVTFLGAGGDTSALPQESMSGYSIFQTEIMKYPYQGLILLWHLSRLFSSLLGAGTILMTYFFALELFPGKKTSALTAAAILAFIPRFVFVSSTANDGNMLALLMTVYLFFMVRVIKGYNSWPNFVMIGITLGLAIITKFSVALVPLTALLFLCFLAWRQGWPLKILVKRIALVTFAALLVSGWWFAFVIWNFNEIETQGPVAGVVNAILPDVASNVRGSDFIAALQGTGEFIKHRGEQSFIEWLIYFSQSFWELRFRLLPDEFLILAHALWVVWLVIGLIVMGAIVTWWRSNEFQRIWMGLLLLHIFAFLPLMLLRHYLNGYVYETAQGRQVLMPAAAAVAILLMVGWSHWSRPKMLNWLKPILPAVLLFWSVTQLYFIYHLFPKPLPISINESTRSRVPQVDVPLHRMLFDAFELVGYKTQVLSDQSTLAVTLVWEAHNPALNDYLTEIQLLDRTGQPVSAWIGHPAGGVYPTRAWFAGNVIYDQVKLPIYNLKPGSYSLEAYLLDAYQRPVHRVTDSLFTAPITIENLAEAPPGFKSLLVDTEDETIEVKYQPWPFEFFNFSYPLYRYRATIPIAWQIDPSYASNKTVNLQLIAPDGRPFTPLNNEGNLRNFMVGPESPPGLYRLRVEIAESGKIVGENISPNFVQVENTERQFTPPPMAHQVNANFYNLVELLGYDLSTSRLKPGEVLSIVAYWKSLGLINRQLIIFSHLYDLDNNVWATSDHRSPPYQGGTVTWIPGQIINDKSEIWIDPKIPNGIYNVHIGLYVDLDNNTQTRLPLVIDEQISDVTYVTLGPIKIGDAPQDVLALDPNPQYTRGDDLGNLVKLRGYDLAYSPDSSTLELILYWECLATTEKNYTTFVHLQDERGQVIAQKDGPPAGGTYPTSLWDVNEVIKDKVTLTLPPGVSTDNYELRVGMYDFSTGERLAISGSHDNAVLLPSFAIADLY